MELSESTAEQLDEIESRRVWLRLCWPSCSTQNMSYCFVCVQVWLIVAPLWV